MSSGAIAAVAQKVCEQRGFEFLGELGAGAFKSAYLIRNGELLAALKVAVISGADDRLIRETEALRACAHPNIARLLDAFPMTVDGLSLWVSLEEYLGGGTLQDRLANLPLDHGWVRGVGVGLAHAVAHLQLRRLVHRDIKPANILFAEDGSGPVLTDFGIVRALNEPSLTKDFIPQGPGTPAYAAPEQLNNEKALIDWRTDQFGVAVVLVRCLLGRHPHEVGGKNLVWAVAATAARQPVPVETVAELAAAGFSSLHRALAPWPVQRFSSPEEFCSAVENG